MARTQQRNPHMPIYGYEQRQNFKKNVEALLPSSMDKYEWRSSFGPGEWQDFRYGTYPHLPYDIRNVFAALMSGAPTGPPGDMLAALNAFLSPGFGLSGGVPPRSPTPGFTPLPPVPQPQTSRRRRV